MTIVEKIRARILIADDEPSVRHLLAESLGESYDCVEVSSAEEALEVVRREKFELVLSDIQMGGISGLEMVPQLLQESPDTMVVMISGESHIESALVAMRAGAFDYITKPFTLEQIGATVRHALEHRDLRVFRRDYEGYLKELVKCRTEELDQTYQTLRSLTQASPLAIFSTDSEARVRMWNPAAEELFGWSEREVVGRDLPLRFEAAGREDVSSLVTPTAGVSVAALEAHCRRRDGSPLSVSLWTTPLKESNGRAAATMTIVADITGKKRAEERIHFLAYHDPVTKLANRASFEESLAKVLEEAGGERLVGVLCLALDGFHKISDTLGHAAADMLLRAFAKRLGSRLKAVDTLARFEGGTFCILLTSIGSAEEASAFVMCMRESLLSPFRFGGNELYLTASSGLALSPVDGDTPQTLLRNASASLHSAALRGNDQHQQYTAELNVKALKRLSVENGLRRALERDEFLVYYQPQVDTATEQIVGAEALVRWQHPKFGLLPPSEFIHVAEESGLIGAIGEWVMGAACVQNRHWQMSGLSPLSVSVNLSPRQFQRPNLVKQIEKLLKLSGLDPSCLELELTESSLMENTEVGIAALHQLKEMGVMLSIDDFGSGYSSLCYLRQLPIDYLKIDRSFVRDMTTNQKDAATVGSIIALARNFDLKVKAEGVETQDQLDALRRLNCDVIQGYWYGRPVPATNFRELLCKDLACVG